MASEKRLGGIDFPPESQRPHAKRPRENSPSSEHNYSDLAAVNKQGSISTHNQVEASSPGTKKTNTSTSNMLNVVHQHGTTTTDSEVDIDLVIYNLSLPECGAEVVSAHCNTKTADLQVQAYAKLAGRGWTFYVQRLPTIIGRKSGAPDELIDIDLAPSKIISRKHAIIQYNTADKVWEVVTVGRNGLKLDGVLIKADNTARLCSGQVLEIGGVQMMFVLPDQDPVISNYFIQKTREAQQARLARHNAGLLAAAAASASNLITNASIPINENHNSFGDKVIIPGNAEANGTAIATSASMPINEGNSSSETEDSANRVGSYPRGVTMVTRPQVPTSQFIDCDLSSEEAKDIKPPFSYATMISQAILSTPDHMMSLAGIYAWISSRYAFYRRSKPGWQNSIRHNLSLNKAFEKVARKQNEPGKGSKWHIVEKYKEELIRKATTGRVTRGVYIPKRPGDDGSQSPVKSIEAKMHQESVPSHSDVISPSDMTQMGDAFDSKDETPDMSYSQRREIQKMMKQQKNQEERIQEELRRREQQELKDSNTDTSNKPQRAPRSSRATIANRAMQIQSMQNAPKHSPQQSPYSPTSAYSQQYSPQHQAYPLSATFQDGVPQFPQMHGFQYMQAYGVPYYNNIGQPNQMISPSSAYGNLHQSQHIQQQPQLPLQQLQPPQNQKLHDHQNQSPDHHHKVNAPPQKLSSGPDLPPPQSNAQVHSPSKDATKGNNADLATHGSPNSEDDFAHQTMNSARKTSDYDIKTPAKSLTRSPQLDSAVKLEITQATGAPESSPAMWKYMNLESTPGTNASVKAGVHDRGPESSPPHGLPLLKNLENSRV